MGNLSQFRKPASKKLLERGTKRHGARLSQGNISKLEQLRRMTLQSTIHGAVSEMHSIKDIGNGRGQDNKGNIHTCRSCTETNYKKGHALWCTKSKYFGMSAEEIKETQEKTKKKKKQTKFERQFKAGAFNPSQEQVSTFFQSGSSVQTTTPAARKPPPSSVNTAFTPAKTNPSNQLAPVSATPKKRSHDELSIPQRATPSRAAKDLSIADDEPLPLTPANISTIIHLRLKKKDKFPNCGVPRQLYCLIEYIVRNSPKMEANSNNILISARTSKNPILVRFWQQHFPSGSCVFTVPVAPCGPQESPPDPNYCMIEGYNIVVARWGLVCPNLKICCPRQGCKEKGGLLVHQRMDMTQRMFQTFCDMNGQRYVLVDEKMTCQVCKTTLRSSEGCVLQQLPPWLRQSFPIDPTYSNGKKDILHVSVSRHFESLGITHVSADSMAHSLREALGNEFIRSEIKYYSLLEGAHEPACHPTFEEWSVHVPSPQGIRDAFISSATSPHTIFGFTNKERYIREMQSVECSVSMADDHHFEALKTFSTGLQKKAGAVWTTCVETGEIPCAVIVPDQSIESYAHAAEQLARRPHFNPKCLWSDVFPSGFGFWLEIFGEEILGHLGLFHWIKRIASTLREKHRMYFMALCHLRECIYYYNRGDYDAVLRCLKEGTLGGKKHTDSEIVELVNSGLFHKRYAKEYIRNEYHPLEVAVVNLENWFVKYKVNASEGKPTGGGEIDPFYNCTLFTPETKGAVERGKRTLEGVIPKISIEELYFKGAAPPKSKNGLPRFKFCGGESSLESYHSSLQHFGNSNMRDSTAEIYCLAGTARYNARCRDRIACGTMERNELSKIQSWARGTPLFYNHSVCHAVNDLAKAAGVDGLVHKDLFQLKAPTGEVFFSSYLVEQFERQMQIPPNPTGKRCMCQMCGSSPRGIEGCQIVRKDVVVAKADKVSLEVINVDDDDGMENKKPASNSPNPKIVIRPVIEISPRPVVQGPTEGTQCSAQSLNPHINTTQGSFIPFMNPHTSSASQPRRKPLFNPYQKPVHVPVYGPQPTVPAGTFPLEAAYRPPTFPPAKHHKQFCCPAFAQYQCVTVWQKGKKAGRPPHSKDCPSKNLHNKHYD